MLKLTTPQFEQRGDQPYAAIRSQVSMRDIGKLLPPLVPEMFAWLQLRGIAAAGAPFFRYNYIDMVNKMDVEVGVPVDRHFEGDARVSPGVTPAGTYVTMSHIGHPNELEAATAELMAWGEKERVMWDAQREGAGEAWRGRFEFYVTGPEDEPDMSKWKTQLAFKVVDKP